MNRDKLLEKLKLLEEERDKFKSYFNAAEGAIIFCKSLLKELDDAQNVAAKNEGVKEDAKGA